MVPCSQVEREFWRLVSCIDEDVIVEYGADFEDALMRGLEEQGRWEDIQERARAIERLRRSGGGG